MGGEFRRRGGRGGGLVMCCEVCGGEIGRGKGGWKGGWGI